MYDVTARRHAERSDGEPVNVGEPASVAAVVVHADYPSHPPRGGRRLQVLRIARHRASERHVSLEIHDFDIRGVDQRVKAELGFDRRMDVLGLTHLHESFPLGE
jgi:hypothetical protein